MAPELASKHGRPLFEHLLAREDFPEWFLNSQLAQERRKRIILALFKLEDEDLLIEFFKVLSKVEKNPSQLARNSTAFWAVGCIGQRRWFDFLEAKLEADWGSIVLHLGPQFPPLFSSGGYSSFPFALWCAFEGLSFC